MRVLVVNTGSSSLKLSVLDSGSDATVASRHVESWAGLDASPVAALLADSGPVDAVGHRVVHGGVELRSAVVIDDAVVERIEAVTPLAPLHQPRALAGIAVAQRAAPELPHVACFDTAYHATLPEAAATYALPAAWRERWPLRRFGFHGLSHAYAARQAAELVGARRVVTCHLGAGASLCASLDGRSVDTTMGFTPLEGLVMATRSGTVDPGLVLWLITEAGLAPDAVRHALEHDSGVLGLAGTSDMREVVAEGGLAFDVYVHTLVRHIGAMAASLDGLDALVFTAGVGENSPEIRAATTARLTHLGVSVDPTRNESPAYADVNTANADISGQAAKVATLVVQAREDLEIGRQVAGVLPPG